MSTITSHYPKEWQGFSLIEMAMVLAIVGLLLAGFLPTLNSQIEQQKTTETRKKLEEIQQALIGFAVTNGRLPCPATSSSNGQESPIGGGNCTNFNDGFVPAATLGIDSVNEQKLPLDAWSNPIRYAVSSWSKSSPSVNHVYTSNNGMASVGISALRPNLFICSTATSITTDACASGKYLTPDTNGGVPVVIYSTGKNTAAGGSGLDEAANPNPNSSDDNRTFVSHTPTPSSVTNGEFDDIVIWVSNNILINRMVAAGKLP
jgi:prepilin-type N-terminal cleavage/methylation domain-containing protein